MRPAPNQTAPNSSRDWKCLSGGNGNYYCYEVCDYNVLYNCLDAYDICHSDNYCY